MRTCRICCFLCIVLAGHCLTSCSSSRSDGQYAIHISKKKSRTSKTKRQYPKQNRRTTNTREHSRPTETARTLPSTQLRESIVSQAERYLGTRYVYGGKRPGGFDCSGFTSYVMGQQGVGLRGSSRQQAQLGKKKAKHALAPGDLAFFGSGGKVTHVGIVKDNTGDQLLVVHSTSSRGVRIDDVNGSQYWRSRFLFGRDIID